jgi:hypothetical protein
VNRLRTKNTDRFQVCDKGSDFGPHLHYQQEKFQDKSVEFIVAAFEGSPLKAKTSVPELRGVKCAGRAPPVTITINCPKGSAAPASKGRPGGL